MQLISYRAQGSTWQVGILGANGKFLGLTERGLPADMIDLISLGAEGQERIGRIVGDAGPRTWAPLHSVELGPPIPRLRRNMFCVGKNYVQHAREFAGSGFDRHESPELPAAPIFFSKGMNTVIGPQARIPAYLDPTATTDYEGELAVVIGNGGRGIRRSSATHHIYGFTIVNDVTARALQKAHGQWFLGKNIDGFCPMGPSLVTADEFTVSGKTILRTFVNEELRQIGSPADLIFDVSTLIETLSLTMTLEAGDIIASGTPAGVGIGFDPPRYLKHGDVVRVSIDGLGELCNTVD
jgi:2-keto-4-pentenoate hydratase/2-oxohepta-3-ene-1,7-dioic acid hydratase in catechol pathway